MKKLLSVLLTLALLITLVPGYSIPGASANTSAGQPFMFPNEKYDKASARVVTEKNVTLTGTIDRIVGTSISYKVEQVTTTSDEPLNSTESITTGIQTTGAGSITVSGVELFPGLNKITFTGVSTTGGNARVSVYLEYRNSPTLHSLEALFHNRNYPINDSEPTVVFSTSQSTNASNRLVIRGFAPNADRVTIALNGNTYGAFVSSTTGQFSTSELNIAAGVNDVTLKVENSGQIVEMTRQIVWYDRSVVHYEQNLVKGTETYPVVSGSEYSMSATTGVVSGLELTGKAILPLPLYNPMPVGNDPGTEVDPDNNADVRAALLNYLKLNLSDGTGATPVTHSPSTSGTDLQFTVNPAASATDIGYITVTYKYNLGSLNTDTTYSYTLEAPNSAQVSTSQPTRFTLRDGNKSYIAGINYLSGYEKDMAANRLLSLEGTAITAAGQSVHTLPVGIEVLIANPGNITVANLSTILQIDGLPANSYRLLPTTEQKDMIINGKSTPVLRAFIEVSQFSKSGSNQLGFKLVDTNATTATRYVTFSLSFGPYVKFDNIANNIIVKYDTSADNQNSVLLNRLGHFRGQLINVAKTADIHYKGSTSPQTVFLYLNNVEIPISPITTNNVTDQTKFQVQYNTDVTIDNVAQALIKSGENRLKFVYHSASDRYESTWTFTVMPENMPEVPAADSDGVYPYRVNQWPPLANDPLFENTGVLYRTKESRLNVYGTFDFIDLGILGTGGSYANIESKLSSLALNTKQNYIVEISNPNWAEPISWDLTKQFKLAMSDRTVLKQENGSDVVLNSGGQNPTNGDARITFYYDVNKQNFFFNIEDQQMPDDGSPLAYVITVYNTGKTGPSVTYRMEVNPVSIPYDLISPRIENRVTNKNFVELIIHAAGASSVMVGKEEAEKIAYITENGANEQTVNAFRYVVKDLRPNRDTKISFTITRGETKLTDTINVKYVPTNIPGSQVLETMKASHKVFNNSLTLAFPKNTNLISSQYNNSNVPATRVYSGNEILFGIANPNDGVVERISGETDNSDYTSMVRAAGELYINYRFQDQAGRYIMASPLYWIDAGLADDPATSGAFDPITTGQDPYPFENYKGKYSNFYTSRLNDITRELVPNNPGTLTLTYDSSMVANANATITVFRLDPVTMEWENVGGVVDSKRGTISVPFTKFGYYVATRLTRGFNDVIDHSYARDAMEAMYAKGIMNAVDAIGIFGGDRYITRGEFTRLIVRALDIPLNYYGTLTFTYYPETITNASNPKALYDYRYIETAARAGIVNGTRPGFFDEDVHLNREQASTILARALQLKLETDSTKAKNQLDKAFKDGIERFDNYAISSILAIQKKGFIVGKPISTSDPKAGYMFDPKARLLRSDAAIIIARVMNDQKKLPAIYY